MNQSEEAALEVLESVSHATRPRSRQVFSQEKVNLGIQNSYLFVHLSFLTFLFLVIMLCVLFFFLNWFMG